MPDNIYIYKDNQQRGPLSEALVRGLLQRGELAPTDYACRHGDSGWQTLAQILPPVAEFAYWRGDLRLTLMVYQNELETHVQSNYADYPYFFKVPAALVSDALPQRLADVSQQIYYAHRLRLQAAEPNDPNYIAIVDSAFRPLTPDEVTAQSWRQSEMAVWESTNCYAVTEQDYQPLKFSDFQ
jgi:hypothetical protein